MKRSAKLAGFWAVVAIGAMGLWGQGKVFAGQGPAASDGFVFESIDTAVENQAILLAIDDYLLPLKWNLYRQRKADPWLYCNSSSCNDIGSRAGFPTTLGFLPKAPAGLADRGSGLIRNSSRHPRWQGTDPMNAGPEAGAERRPPLPRTRMNPHAPTRYLRCPV